MWVPQEASFTWSNNPFANKIDFWGSGAQPLIYGFGISVSPNTGFLGDMIYDYLLTNQTQYLGKLMALGNVRFIVYHNDSALANGDPSLAYQAFDKYFTQYTNYLYSFLNSTEYNWFEFNVLTDYVNTTLYTNFIENYKNSTTYQNFQNFLAGQIREFKNNSSDLSPDLWIAANENFTASIDKENEKVYNDYLNSYKSSSIYQNLNNSRSYLNDFLNSQAYQGYLKNFSKEYQNFIDSPIYNNSHNYLDSSEYLILTGSQYFANSTENRNFINSVEYRALLNYYFLYTSNQYPDYAKAANEKYGASYQNFQISSEYQKYNAYLNYFLSNYPEMFDNLQSQKDLKLCPFFKQ